MIDKLKSDLELIKNSPEFQKDLYLSSCSKLQKDWQLDFYSKKTKTITSFTVKDNKPELISKDSKIFQKLPKDLEKLNLNKIAVEFIEAEKIAEQEQKKLCPDSINKKIIILQKIKYPIWNLTYITSTLKIINIKINAQTEEVIDSTCESVMQFRQS